MKKLNNYLIVIFSLLLIILSLSCDTAFSEPTSVTIRFDQNYDGFDFNLEDRTYEANYVLSAYELPQLYVDNEEVCFDGWYLGNKKIETHIVLTKDIKLKAKWIKRLPRPKFETPNNDTYISTNSHIKINCKIPGAEIYYSFGYYSSPTKEEGTLYTEPFKITETTYIRAMAYKEGYAPSPMASEQYSVYQTSINFSASSYDIDTSYDINEGEVLTAEMFPPDPSRDDADFLGWFDYNGKQYTPGTTVIFNDSTAIYLYSEWNVYDRVTSIQIYDSARNHLWADDEEINYNDYFTLETRTEGADIYYTLDNTEPTKENGTLYKDQQKIYITEPTTIRAIGYKEKMKPSYETQTNLTIKTYTMNYSDDYSSATLPKSFTYKNYDKLTNDQLPNRECKGYKFLGWYYYGDRKANVGDELIGSSRLEAKYERLPYVSNITINGNRNRSELLCDYNKEIILETATVGASIYYTLDGTKPSETNGTLYDSANPPIFTKDLTIKAIAIKEGMNSSDIRTVKLNTKYYTLHYDYEGYTDVTKLRYGDTLSQEQLPIINKTNEIFQGWYNSDYYHRNEKIEAGYKITSDLTIVPRWERMDTIQPINRYDDKEKYVDWGKNYYLHSDTKDVNIYYTTDGTEPKKTPEYLYTNPIPIDRENIHIKAIATKKDMIDSPLFETTLKVIKYKVTFDNNYIGITPDSLTNLVYGHEITAEELPIIEDDENEFLGWHYYYQGKYVDFKPGYIITQNITVKAHWRQYPKLDSITVSPDRTWFDYKDKITLSIPSTPDADIYYTLDGTYPSIKNGIHYEKPIEILGDCTLRAFGHKKQMIDSPLEDRDIRMNLYEISYISGQFERLKGYKKGDKLTEKELPTLSKENYEFLGWSKYPSEAYARIGDEITEDLTLCPEWREFDQLTIEFIPSTTTFVDYLEKVELKPSVDGATIYYTLDGTTPTTNSSVYKEPFTIDKQTNIKAIAKKEGYIDSREYSRDYRVRTYSISYKAPLMEPYGVPATKRDIYKGYKLKKEDLPTLVYKPHNSRDPHFSFTGWYNEDKSYKYKEGDVVNSNITMYADWEAYPKCKIEFSIKENMADYNDKLVLIPTPSNARIYYTHSTTSHNDSSLEEYKGPLILTEDSTINAYAECEGYDTTETIEKKYAIKKYTVSFDYPNMTAREGMKKGDKVYLDEPKKLDSTQTNFLGWFEEDTNKKVETPYSAYKDVTLVPKWEDNTPPLALYGLNAIPYKDKITLSWGLDFIWKYVVQKPIEQHDEYENQLLNDIKFICVEGNGIKHIRYEVTNTDRINKYGKIDITDVVPDKYYTFNVYTEDAVGLRSAPVSVNALIISGYDYKTPIDSPIIRDGHTYFGNYPQSHKENWITVSSSSTKINGWDCYEGSDGYYYVLVNNIDAYPIKSDTGRETKSAGQGYYKNGERVYNTSSTDYFRLEPIEWVEVYNNYINANSVDCGKVYTTNFILDGTFFSDAFTERTINGKKILPNNYQYSRIRAFLNGTSYVSSNNDTENLGNQYIDKGFLQLAFTSNARNLLRSTTVDNSEASLKLKNGNVYLPNGQAPWDEKNNLGLFTCENTTDKIFLPSEHEMEDNTYNIGTTIPTDYTRAKRVSYWEHNDKAALFYRSPCYYSYSYNDDPRYGYGKTVLSNTFEYYSIRDKCGILPWIIFNK